MTNYSHSVLSPNAQQVKLLNTTRPVPVGNNAGRRLRSSSVVLVFVADNVVELGKIQQGLACTRPHTKSENPARRRRFRPLGHTPQPDNVSSLGLLTQLELILCSFQANAGCC